MMTAGSRAVLSAGFVALDVIKTRDGSWLRAGGTASNVAANLAYLGWSAAIVGKIGADDAGHVVRADLEMAGVGLENLALDSTIGTPIVVHEVRVDGHRFTFGCTRCGRRYVRHRPASADQANAVLERPEKAEVFFFDRASNGTIALAEGHRSVHSLVMYEPSTSGRPGLHVRASIAAHVVKYSAERAASFSGWIDDLAIPLHIVTLGANGVRFRHNSGTWTTMPAFEGYVVDAAGAGDWFTAVLVHALPQSVEQWTLAAVVDAISAAQAAASLSCALPGARTLAAVMSREAMWVEVKRMLDGADASPLELPRLGEGAADSLCDSCLLPLA